MGEQIEAGKQGFIHLFFGTVDTDEVRENKLTLVSEQIEQADRNLKVANKELQSFTEKALVELKKFNEQKVADIKDILLNITILNIKISKKGLNTWKCISETVESI